MASLKEWLPEGLVALLVAMMGWLFHKRASNQVKNDNAGADRESRFQDNLQALNAALTIRVEELTKERDDLKADLMRAENKMAMVQMLADGNETGLLELARQSAFTDFDRPLRPRPPPRAMSSHDVFQAADPYAPPPKKRT